MVAVEDVGLAVIRPTSFFYRLGRLTGIGGQLASLDESSEATSQNDWPDMAVRCEQVEGPISLVMPEYTSLRSCELVDKLFQSLAKRGHSLSEDETELRATACFAAMCWLIASLEDGPDAQLAIKEFQAIPELVFATIAVSLAEQQGIGVLEAATGVGDADWIDYDRDCQPCFYWVGRDRATKYSGPIESTQRMAEYCQTADHLRTINHAIGGEFDAVDPEALSYFLEDPHFRMLQTLTFREQDSCFYWICFRK